MHDSLYRSYVLPTAFLANLSNLLHVAVQFASSSSRALKDGDIINIDITVRTIPSLLPLFRDQLLEYQFPGFILFPRQVYLNGHHGDTSATFLVGLVDEQGVNLTHHTKEALVRAIAVCGPGVELKRVGDVIR